LDKVNFDIEAGGNFCAICVGLPVPERPPCLDLRCGIGFWLYAGSVNLTAMHWKPSPRTSRPAGKKVKMWDFFYFSQIFQIALPTLTSFG